MTQLAKQEQIEKFQPFSKTSIFWTLEATFIFQKQLMVLSAYRLQLMKLGSVRWLPVYKFQKIMHKYSKITGI